MMRFVVLSVSLLILAAGVGLGVATLARGRSSPRETLNQRLASGEIGVEEYRERLAALGRSRTGAEWLPAVLLIVAGLIGVIVFAWSSIGRGPMRNMMGGMMNDGMDSMMRGRTNLSAPEPSPGAVEIVVSAKEFVFSPREFRLERGKTVNLILDNLGQAYHTLTIEDLDFQIESEANRRSSGALTVERRGNFTIICTVPGHADAGMRGNLVVE